MASTSSAATPQWKFDVFLSFRGADTRDGFVSHLYDALRRDQIETFIDNRLEGGENISPALLEKIEQSSISVVIFSKNYADSPWCLEELEKILECKETLGQMVLPVFYKVVPTHVRELSDSYGDALAEHRRKSGPEQVNRWGRALTEIADLKGWNSNDTKPETKLIEDIVHDIWNKLYAETSSDFCGLVGIDSRIKEVESLLCEEAPGVRIVGIWGMDGIGKTTLAEVMYERISAHFEGRCFLANIRQELERSTTVALRNKILSETLGKDLMSVGTLNLLPMPTKRMLQRKKVLIVLDDVSSHQQLKALLGEDGLLGQGSRVLVTSVDKQVLKNRCHSIYEVKALNYHEAVQLFKFHAFGKQKTYPTEEHRQLSERMVEYAKGIPLALKVLGSNMYDKDVEEWKSELAKLQGTLDLEIQKILRISYDGLESTEKSMFLDIACFFGTCSKDRVQEIFNVCGFFATRGLSRLNDKCLIDISGDEIRMHDLLQKLGRDIVCEECINDPRKRSRLWNPEDICHVLTHYKGTETVEAISLNVSKIGELKLSRTVFEEMYNLRLLEFYGIDLLFEDNRILLPEGLECLSNKLRILHWNRYPLKSLPSNFCPENLVELRMSGSHLINLSGLPRLVHLKLMDLSKSESLVEVPPSVGYCSKLTLLDLSFCGNLRCLPSLLHLTSLKDLSLAACAKIEELPEVPLNIQKLSLSGTAIKQLPSNFCPKYLVELRMSGSRLTNLSGFPRLLHLELMDLSKSESLVEVPPSVGYCSELTLLDLSFCGNLRCLPSLLHLTSLKDLNLAVCAKIEELPELPLNIQKLSLSGTAIKQLPSSIGHLSQLADLDLDNCKRLESVPSGIGQLKRLKNLSHRGCYKFINPIMCPGRLISDGFEDLQDGPLQDLVFPWGDVNISIGNMVCPLPSHLRYLHDLHLDSCGISEIPDTLGSLVSLQTIDFTRNHFKSIPTSIKQLSDLKRLHLRQCRRLQCLPELPSSLEELDVSHCSSLKSVHDTFPPLHFKNSDTRSFKFAHCYCLDENVRFQIMTGFHLRIQRPTTFMLDRKLYNNIFPSVQLCFPGNEVPEWFSYKATVRSSSKIIWPSQSYRQLPSCIVCAVVAPKELQDFGHDWGKCRNFKVYCGCSYVIKSTSSCHNFSQEVIGRIDKPHVFIWYRSNDHILSHFSDEASYKFDLFWSINNVSFEGLHVIKWGFHPLLTRDDGVDVVDGDDNVDDEIDDGDGDGDGCGNDDDDEINEKPCSKRLKV